MEQLRSALRRSLGRALRALPQEERLAAAWPVVCGAALAKRAEVAGYDPETAALTVAVLHREWMEPFRVIQRQLVGDLARVSGVPVRTIHLVLQGDFPGAPPTS